MRCESTWRPSAASSTAGGGGHGGWWELAACPVLPHGNVKAGKKRGNEGLTGGARVAVTEVKVVGGKRAAG
jgi:hypothetical protein